MSDTSSLDYSLSDIKPEDLPAPYSGYLTKAVGKELKKKYKATKAKIKGKPHPSSSAPEQGEVVSVQLFRNSTKAGKENVEKVAETVHIQKDGKFTTNSEYQAEKRKKEKEKKEKEKDAAAKKPLKK
ncbi:hypothetical protein QBC38DRAFT_449392 [Podospora fimiseda]|uniref:Uncharacterized protein n=1 Tax=Podospora fimiseda TaxID=252190 RepID=A0AAN6YNS1_9PEZI|nr:hypothetical protein QBC38DRAFT_449392 [Podospora fimiseda]